MKDIRFLKDSVMMSKSVSEGMQHRLKQWFNWPINVLNNNVAIETLTRNEHVDW